MTSSPDESAESGQSDDLGVTDDQLPEDLQPEENPLAEGLDAGETAGDLLEEGKSADQDSEQDESDDEQGSSDSPS